MARKVNVSYGCGGQCWLFLISLQFYLLLVLTVQCCHMHFSSFDTCFFVHITWKKLKIENLQYDFLFAKLHSLRLYKAFINRCLFSKHHFGLWLFLFKCLFNALWWCLYCVYWVFHVINTLYMCVRVCVCGQWLHFSSSFFSFLLKLHIFILYIVVWRDKRART